MLALQLAQQILGADEVIDEDPPSDIEETAVVGVTFVPEAMARSAAEVWVWTAWVSAT